MACALYAIIRIVNNIHIMIEHSISSKAFSPMQPKQMIWLNKYLKISLAEKLEQLYQSTSQRNRKLYNVRIYEQSNQSGSDALVKNRLDQKTKHYLTWCYLALNWQYVSTENLDTFLGCLPSSQLQAEQIRVQPQRLKISKFNKSLDIDLVSYNLSIQQNKYYLDSFDHRGKSEYLQYYPSLCQIKVNGETHRFDGLIRLVESCELFMAVVTYYSVYIIGLKDGIGASRFALEQCIDVKWSKRGLYYLQRNGHLGLLERQTTFTPCVNKFSQHSSISLDLIDNEFLPERIAVTGTNETNSSLILLASAQSNPKKILLQVVNNPKYGMNNQSLVFELKEISGDILFKNLVVVRKELTLILVNGKDGKVQDYHEYKFETI